MFAGGGTLLKGNYWLEDDLSSSPGTMDSKTIESRNSSTLPFQVGLHMTPMEYAYPSPSF